MSDLSVEVLKLVIVGIYGESTLVGRLLQSRYRIPLPSGQARDAIRARNASARNAVRIVVPDRRARRGAGPGHHHRHDADLASHARSSEGLRHHRRAGAQRIPEEHDPGAAQADAALLVIDAKEGVQEQSLATVICCTCWAFGSCWWRYGIGRKIDCGPGSAFRNREGGPRLFLVVAHAVSHHCADRGARRRQYR